MTVQPTAGDERSAERGFSLIEVLISLAIMTGAFMMLTGAIPLAALLHRAALERETALSLAQFQLEYFLTNPGPFPGETGASNKFINVVQFPPGYTGSYAAYAFAAGSGLTEIVVQVTPPHGPRVELSAIDTTYSNIWK